MTTDVKQAISDKIRKLQTLLELAEDKETLALMRELVGSNGNGTSVKAEPQVQPTRRKKLGRPKHGELQRTVENTLSAATEPITSAWIAERMLADGFRFKAGKPRVAVSECLRLAKNEGRATLVKTIGVTHYWMPAREAQK